MHKHSHRLAGILFVNPRFVEHDTALELTSIFLAIQGASIHLTCSCIFLFRKSSRRKRNAQLVSNDMELLACGSPPDLCCLDALSALFSLVVAEGALEFLNGAASYDNSMSLF